MLLEDAERRGGVDMSFRGEVGEVILNGASRLYQGQLPEAWLN